MGGGTVCAPFSHDQKKDKNGTIIRSKKSFRQY